MWIFDRFREQKTVPLVNHAFARVTPTIFVIIVVSRGLSSKALVLLVRTQIRIFAPFSSQTSLFLAGQRHGLPKALFSGPQQDSFTLNSLKKIYQRTMTICAGRLS